MMNMHRGSRTAASPRLRVEPRSSAKRAYAPYEQGQAAFEFALVLPVLLAILLGTLVFGIALNNYLELTYATSAAAQQLSISQGITSPNPCTTAESAGVSAAPLLHGLTTSSFTPSFAGPGGSTCTNLVAGDSVQVTGTYPCKLVVLGVNFAPGCTLTAQATMVIQ